MAVTQAINHHGKGTPVFVSEISASDNSFSGPPASATAALYSNGSYFATNDFLNEDQWVIPKNEAGNYYVRATLALGTNPTSGTMNTWLSMSGTRTWSNDIPSANNTTLNSVLLIDVATDSGGTNIVGSFTMTIQAVTGLGS